MQANETQPSLRLSAGRLLSVIALVFCVPLGALFVSVATGAVGVFLGITSYALGARRLGMLAVVLCTAAMFVGLLVGQGVIPGDAFDRAVDGWFRNMPTERFTED
ncbi:MAG: hypothetical protein AVDCRST_MAG01-01-2311 [uncultured Rubrobacteraceae bacterium]|uniref:Uncharacterized protein n=1 Tax=uncultured Rubrobacteraceae bacterium TaxID=349277 RepID=A0A6J4PT40_9ACTN|nr:MAG: hypothetical protein AVDCRST_MAG01-01-2311 [uncultured Rubrobacteraceae bacterium]